MLKSVMANEVVLGLQIAEQAANASATADRNGTATASEGSGRASADFEEAVLQNSAEFYRSASSSSLRLPCAAGRLAKHPVKLLPRKRSVHPPRADDHSRGEFPMSGGIPSWKLPEQARRRRNSGHTLAPCRATWLPAGACRPRWVQADRCGCSFHPLRPRIIIEQRLRCPLQFSGSVCGWPGQRRWTRPWSFLGP